MKIIPLVHQTLRKLALIGLLFAPFALTPSHAVELVGKPALAGGTQSAAVASSEAALSQVQAEANHFEQLPDAPLAPESSTRDPVQGDVKQVIDEIRDNFKHDDAGGLPFDPDMLIPIVGMLLLFGGPVLLVIVLAILHYRAKARRQQSINMNIDKLLAAGRDIPIELLMGEDVVVKRNVSGEGVVYRTDDGNMQKGVRNICLGVGWFIFATIFFNIKIGAIGFIYIGLGISKIIIWRLSGTKTEPVKVQD